MPSRKEVQWSQLKVGALVLAGAAILIFLIFLMSGSTGGLFAQKLTLRVYFDNASGLKQGAPVTLEGVTIGNVTKIRVVPERSPTPVEVTMKVPGKLKSFLHTDSAAAIASAGVLGDSYVDITSNNATGPPPANNAELLSHSVSGIQQVMNTSQDALKEATKVMKKTGLIMDALNSEQGSAGKFLTDDALYNNLNTAVTNTNKLIEGVNKGEGAIGKMAKDPEFAKQLNGAVTNLNTLLKGMNDGKGTVGQLMVNRALYDHFDATADEAQKLVKAIHQDPKKYFVIHLKVF